jgi:hypothetical protein
MVTALETLMLELVGLGMVLLILAIGYGVFVLTDTEGREDDSQAAHLPEALRSQTTEEPTHGDPYLDRETASRADRVLRGVSRGVRPQTPK